MRHPRKIIVITLGLVMLSLLGFFRIRPISYLEDYLSLDQKAKGGLQFVQEHFGGILPLEVVVDTQKKGGVYHPDNMRHVAQLQAILDAQPHFSSSLSLVDFFKAGTQAFYAGDRAFYKIPTRANFPFIRRYLSHTEGLPVAGQGAFTDAAAQKYRVSTRVSNVGSNVLSAAINDIKPRIDALLRHTHLRAAITGTTTLLIRQNDYLVGSFARSMLLAFLVVALSISVLLRQPKLVYISLLTNLIPLCIMVGAIGFINLKVTPSTILTFTISFGISIDNSIHLLSHYHAERSLFGATRQALARTIQGVGPNMIQATIILFFSFGFFVFSSFDSIVYFGVLISSTLVFTILANLIFLPALLVVAMPTAQHTAVSGTKS